MHLSKILTPFRRLRWKLTFSYTLVTVAVVLALEATGLLALGLYVSRPTFWIHELETSAADLAADVRRFLEASPPDHAGLESWLQETFPPGDSQESIISIGARVEGESSEQTETSIEGPRIILSDDDWAVVTDPAGELVVVNSPAAADAAEPGRPFVDPLAPEESQQLIDNALRGEFGIRRISGGTLLAAQPISDESGNVMGALYVRLVSYSLLPREFLSSSLQILGYSLLFFTIAAGIIGTVFGLFTARGFVRRLKDLDSATEAWGQGDFSATVRDTSPDEIGQLTRRMSLMAEQIQNLLQSRQELATLEERNRLARDLHDSVKQQVFATTMTLGTAETLWERDPQAARQKVAEALALSRQAQQELTGLIHELRPVALEGKGLAVALGEYVKRWSRQTGIEAGVAVQEERTIPLEVEQALFRLAQEALANVSKHSGAEHVELALACTENAITLEVADDGRGFEAVPTANTGLGLRSMWERIESLDGELTVESAPGTGTRIVARCELKDTGSHERQ